MINFTGCFSSITSSIYYWYRAWLYLLHWKMGWSSQVCKFKYLLLLNSQSHLKQMVSKRNNLLVLCSSTTMVGKSNLPILWKDSYRLRYECWSSKSSWMECQSRPRNSDRCFTIISIRIWSRITIRSSDIVDIGELWNDRERHELAQQHIKEEDTGRRNYHRNG